MAFLFLIQQRSSPETQFFQEAQPLLIYICLDNWQVKAAPTADLRIISTFDVEVAAVPPNWRKLLLIFPRALGEQSTSATIKSGGARAQRVLFEISPVWAITLSCLTDRSLFHLVE